MKALCYTAGNKLNVGTVEKPGPIDSREVIINEWRHEEGRNAARSLATGATPACGTYLNYEY